MTRRMGSTGSLHLRRSRRRFLHQLGVLGLGSAFAVRSGAARSPQATVHETRVISVQSRYYHGWPTLARRKNGDLLLAYSGGREAHVCPFGRVELMVSHNQGASWGWPQTLLDSAIDDRDAGVMETAQGTLLVTTFTSLAYEPILKAAENVKSGDADVWPAERLQAWQLAHERLTAAQRQAELGQWIIRSRDGGVTWSARYASLVNSPHGPIQLADGRLLYPGKELWGGSRRVGVCESTDDGATWKWLADIRPRAGDTIAEYHELHGVETADGRLIVHIRNENKAAHGETLQSESTDGGRTWSEPHSIGVWGLPSFLMRLRDDRLLMTYGHRRPPFGNQARISEDHGRAWSEPLIVSSDGTSGDLGYPSTVELEDKALLTVWYEQMPGSSRAVLRQTRWTIE